MLKNIGILLLVFLLFSCGKEEAREKKIAKIAVELHVLRFDQRFAKASEEDLPKLKTDFPYLFPHQYFDSLWVKKLHDTIQQEINVEIAKEFPNFSTSKKGLYSFFQHVEYYFPNTKIPTVVTLTSEVDYKNKVIWGDGFLLISLDTYLGKKHHFYLGIQEYLKKNFEQDQILPDVATAFAKTLLPRPRSRIFLDHMLYYGKILYLKDLLIPFKTDAQKIGYEPEELKWVVANEDQIWRYFVEKEYLFASDSELYSRFLYPGPFSKFYLELDNESPARVGQYIGWQMVRQFMDKNPVSVEELLNTDAQTILNKSNYKPRK